MVAMGSAVRWRVDRTPPLFDVDHRQVSVQDQRSSGCVRGRWICSDGFIYCSSNLSLCAKGLLLIQGGHGIFIDGGGRLWRSLALSGCTGSRALVVIFVFFRGLCASWSGQLPMLYPFRTYLYSYAPMYIFLI
jgi:hypothetical protein